MARLMLGLPEKFLEHWPARQFMQQFLCRLRTRAACTQYFARRSEPLQPHFVLRTKLRFEFLPKPLRERRTLAIRGDRDL
jgi:hypothetical protein